MKYYKPQALSVQPTLGINRHVVNRACISWFVMCVRCAIVVFSDLQTFPSLSGNSIDSIVDPLHSHAKWSWFATVVESTNLRHMDSIPIYWGTQTYQIRSLQFICYRLIYSTCSTWAVQVITLVYIKNHSWIRVKLITQARPKLLSKLVFLKAIRYFYWHFPRLMLDL